MNFPTLACWLVVASAAAGSPAIATQFVTFDPQSSKTVIPTAINASGDVTGSFIATDESQHAFVRKADGTIVIFDTPGAQAGTWSMGINRHGTVAGWGFCNGFPSAFMRSVRGKITCFAVASQSTHAAAINDLGVVTGSYGIDPRFHGFVRAADGTITTFDDPKAVNGTVPFAMNRDGEITGGYYDSNNIMHPFIRFPDGQFTEFDPKNDIDGAMGRAINNKGVVAGTLTNFGEYDEGGFLRRPSGTIKPVNAPGASRGGALSINSKGYIAGEAGGHSFIRSPAGVFTQFDPSGAAGSQAIAINDNGAVVGNYWDSAGTHGYLRLP